MTLQELAESIGFTLIVDGSDFQIPDRIGDGGLWAQAYPNRIIRTFSCDADSAYSIVHEMAHVITDSWDEPGDITVRACQTLLAQLLDSPMRERAIPR